MPSMASLMDIWLLRVCQKRRWVDPVPSKEIPCNAARILVGVKKN